MAKVISIMQFARCSRKKLNWTKSHSHFAYQSVTRIGMKLSNQQKMLFLCSILRTPGRLELKI